MSRSLVDPSLETAVPVPDYHPNDIQLLQRYGSEADEALARALKFLRNMGHVIADTRIDLLIASAADVLCELTTFRLEIGAGGKPGQKPRTQLKRRPALTPAERRAYEQALEPYRNPEGYVCCVDCGRPLLEIAIQRHHIRHRSQGGLTVPANIVPLCLICHSWRHGIRILPESTDEPCAGYLEEAA